jgi:site-specific recombinase XerD
MSEKPISPLRRRMIEDMSVRRFGEKTQHDYIRHIESFAKFLGRSPDTATAEDLRCYQVHQTEAGVQPPSVNSSTVALRPPFHGHARPRQSRGAAHARALSAQAAARVEP